MSFWDAFFLFLIYIPLIIVWGFAVLDIFRRDDIHGGSKALWLVCVIFLPFFGTLLYLLLRRPGATREERAAHRRREPRLRRRLFAGEHDGEQLSVLADLHDRGKLNDSEFAAEKARVPRRAQRQGAPATTSVSRCSAAPARRRRAAARRAGRRRRPRSGARK